MSTLPVVIVGVHLDPASGSSIVLLGDAPSPSRVLPIFIGPAEMNAIIIGLQGVEMPRPGTHDLLLSSLDATSSELIEVSVVALQGGTFLAELTLGTPSGRRLVDARPSDGIALAVRRAIPITVATDVFETAGVPVLHDSDEPLPDAEIDRIVGEFHRFLESAEPADFVAPEAGTEPDAEPRPEPGPEPGGSASGSEPETPDDLPPTGE